jgi:hypothetical protein
MTPTLALAPDQAALRRRCRAALYEHRRRARADRQAVRYGLRDLEALARASRTCCYWGALLTATTLTFDHATPTGRATDYSLGNLAICCGPCNEAKGLLNAEEFRALLALLRTWHPRRPGPPRRSPPWRACGSSGIWPRAAEPSRRARWAVWSQSWRPPPSRIDSTTCFAITGGYPTLSFRWPSRTALHKPS